MSLKGKLGLTLGKKLGISALLLALSLPVAGYTRTTATFPTHEVTIEADGRSVTLNTNRTSPHLILAKAGVKLGTHDTYDLKKIDQERSVISVKRALPVEITYEGETKTVFTTKDTVGEALTDEGYDLTRLDANVGFGEKLQENQHIVLKESAEKLAALEREREEQHVITSRGHERYSAVYTMEATAYLPTDGGGYGITATGIPAGRGVVAVDPDVIPLGSRLYIPGYGEAIAADTGGAIWGDSIDLCMESYWEAMEFGRRDVTVYVLH